MDSSRVKLAIFFIEKKSFSLKLFSGHSYEQSLLRLSEVLQRASGRVLDSI